MFCAQYFYNAISQEYLYWDAASKSYIPVPGGNPAATAPLPMTAEDQAILSNPAADAPLEMKKSLTPNPEDSAALVPSADDGCALDPVPTSSATPEKKDDDDSKKDNDKPRSIAAVKVALQLQHHCTQYEKHMCKGNTVKTCVAVCRS